MRNLHHRFDHYCRIPHIRPAGNIFLIVIYSMVAVHQGAHYESTYNVNYKCTRSIRTRVLFKGGPYKSKVVISQKKIVSQNLNFK